MLKTYSELSGLKVRLSEYDDIFKTTVGLRVLGKNNPQEFLTNRYFQDALGITKLPSHKEIYESKKLNEALNFADDFLKGYNESRRSIFSAELRLKLDRDGYLVIPHVIDNADKLRELVLHQARHERDLGNAYTYGEGNQRVYNLLNKDKVFRELIEHPLILEIMDHMFDRDTLHDRYVLSSWHANIVNKDEGVLHIDAAVPEPIPPWIIRSNIGFWLDDFTHDNGATLVLPGSHKLCKKPTALDQTRDDLVPLSAPKGSLAIWHGHLWHKSGQNRTDRPRVALLGCFAASHLLEMAQEENHMRVVERRFLREMSPRLKQLVGFNHGIKKGAF